MTCFNDGYHLPSSRGDETNRRREKKAKVKAEEESLFKEKAANDLQEKGENLVKQLEESQDASQNCNLLKKQLIKLKITIKGRIAR